MEKIKQFVKDVYNIYKTKNIPTYSAQCAFWIALSVIPFSMVVMLIFQALPFQPPDIAVYLESYFPEDSYELILSVVENLARASNPVVLIVSIIGALWAASRSMMAIRQGLNSVYGVKETRNYFYVRLLSLIYVFLFVLAIVLTMFFLVFGSRFYAKLVEFIPFLKTHDIIYEGFKIFLTLIVLTLLFMAFYTYFSNQRQKFIFQFPGAVVAAAGWIISSYIFSLYFLYSTNFTYLYGSLAGITMLLLWLVTCLYIFFIGAAVNSIRATYAKRRTREKYTEEDEYIGTDL